MKKVIALVATLFAVTAFAQTPAPVAPAAPAKVEVKKDAKPAKSDAPAVKETKATTPSSK